MAKHRACFHPSRRSRDLVALALRMTSMFFATVPPRAPEPLLRRVASAGA
jgi:hypothetical protein